MAEQADAHDSKSCGETRVSSILTFGTSVLIALQVRLFDGKSALPIVMALSQSGIFMSAQRSDAPRRDVALRQSRMGHFIPEPPPQT